MKTPISESERPYFVRFALIFAGMVVFWAILHDIFLINVDARHFTDYHRRILPLENHVLLAIQYAVFATFGPALVYGFIAYFACRFGRKDKVGIVKAALGFILMIFAVEILLLAIGFYARSQFVLHGVTFYPAVLYPELSPGLVFTQSVNISAYLFAPFLGACYLLVIYLKRKPQAPNQALQRTEWLVTECAPSCTFRAKPLRR